MVVGDDHLHAQLFGQQNLFVVGDAQVHRHQQAVGFRQLPHRVLVQTVSLGPKGRVGVGDDAVPAQRLRHQRGRADAVHIIVAVDHRGDLFIPGLTEQRDRLVHVLHRHGVVQLLQGRVQKDFRFGSRLDAAGVQKPRRRTAIGQQRSRRLRGQRAGVSGKKTKQGNLPSRQRAEISFQNPNGSAAFCKALYTGEKVCRRAR